LDEEQKLIAEKVIELLRSMGHVVNTILRPAEKFWEGEEYHQDYYNKTGGEPYCHIRVKKF
jgi:peptide-methionine (S)-S-oxide reductase/peptide methionine sulfoxide reductase msrA/msrB